MNFLQLRATIVFRIAEMVVIQVVEVVEYTGAGGDLGVLGPRWIEILGGNAVVEVMRLRSQFVVNFAVDVHQALVRTENLVQAERVTVDPKRLEIGNVVRGVSHGIDEYAGIAARLDAAHNVGDRIDRADQVRAMGEEYPARFIAQ